MDLEQKEKMHNSFSKKEDVSFAVSFPAWTVETLSWGAERKVVRHLVTSVLYM